MKHLFLTMILLAGLSCDATSDTIANENMNADIENSEQESSNPGEITFRAKVMQIFPAEKEICGVALKNVMEVEITEIVKRGSSIAHTPRKKERILVHFAVSPSDLDATKVIEVIAKESLCGNASTTYFTINSYKML